MLRPLSKFLTYFTFTLRYRLGLAPFTTLAAFVGYR